MNPLINTNNSRNITKKELAYNAIKKEVLQNTFPPGTFLVERELCKALDVSRTPVREALQQLANEGLVEFIPGRGALVTNLTYEDIIETYDVREVLEGLAVRMFTLYSSQSEIGKLDRIYKNIEEALKKANIEALVKHDVAFHRCIIEGCRNNRLKAMIKIINDHVERITNTIRKDKIRAKTTVAHHKQILDAIKQKDAALAESKIREHISDSKHYHLKKYNFSS